MLEFDHVGPFKDSEYTIGHMFTSTQLNLLYNLPCFIFEEGQIHWSTPFFGGSFVTPPQKKRTI